VFHFQKAQRRFHQIAAHYGYPENVVEDVYRMAPSGLDFGVGSSYATWTSSTSAAHDDNVPDLDHDLNTMVDVLS
jgi:hypothetical protein